MYFKNLMAHRLTAQVDPAVLAEHLELTPQASCLPSQTKVTGFSKIYGSSQRLFTHEDCHLFCLSTEEKIVPASVVKTELDKRLQLMRMERGEYPTRSERNEIKERIRDEFTKKALVRNTHLWAYIDNPNRLLIINTTSAKQADGLVASIRGGMPGVRAFPLRPADNIAETTARWLEAGEAPRDIEFGDRCIIRLPDGQEVKYTKSDLQDELLKGYLRDGFAVKEVSLTYKNETSFVMTDDFGFKGFRLSDALLSTISTGSAEPLDCLAEDLGFSRVLISELMQLCLSAIGGEKGAG